MEKSEAVRRFNEGKHFVETCLKDIASLDQSNDKELRKVLRGTVMVEVSYKAAENFGKVCGYVIDGKDGAQKLKDKLFDLKEKVVQLYNDADRQNLVTIKEISKAIISEIKEVEEWADDDHFIPNPIPETGDNECLKIGDKNPPTKAEPLNIIQVTMNIKNEPFQPKKDGKPIPYQKCYERLANGKIRRSAGESETVKAIHEQYDLKTFQYCVDRANMKYICVEGKKCFIYLFLRCISEYYENPSEYRKAAAKAFGRKSICSVGGHTKQDFYNLFSGIFKDEDLQRKKK